MRQDIKRIKLAELTDDCRLLVISHMPLAYAMAWRMKDRGVSLEDLRQEGCLGLCEAAMRYNETIDCTFATYASHWCKKMMYLAIRRHQSSDSVQEENIREPEKDDDLLRTGQRQRIDEALQCLTKQEQQLVRLFYGLDGEQFSITEIATEMGFTKARASALHQRALRKLEKALMERPLVDYLAPWLD
jgi:RNA polymerase sigma factor (sigma-70 family)